MNDRMVIAHMTAMALGPLSIAILMSGLLRRVALDLERGKCFGFR